MVVAVLLLSIPVIVVDDHSGADAVNDRSLGTRFAGGTGAEDDPYRISTVEQLQAIADDPDGHYVLVNDIDASETVNWNGGKGFEPIGRCPDAIMIEMQGAPFTGSFNGKGCTIAGLSVHRTSFDYTGLFGYIDIGGSVSNVDLIKNNISGRFYVGGLVGWNFGNITNCHTSGNVDGSDHIGGLVGGNTVGIITNCSAVCNVDGYDEVGGLVGDNYKGTITNCYAIINVTGNSYVGGLVGKNEFFNNPNDDITGCYTNGSVNGNQYVGGLVGYDECFNIVNCHYNYNSFFINNQNVITVGAMYESMYNTWLSSGRHLAVDDFLSKSGSDYLINDVDDFKQLLAFGHVTGLSFKLTSDLDLSTENGFYIPHFAGYFDGDGHIVSGLNINLPDFHNLGLFGYVASGGSLNNISLMEGSVNGGMDIGGLVGRNGDWCYPGGAITNCHTIGDVSGTERHVGGLVGYNREIAITNCSATGNVSGTEKYVGGLVGRNHIGDIINCYATCNVNGNDRYIGGLVGNNDEGTIINCHVTGNVTGNGNGNFYGIGGLVGYNDKGDIINCYTTGSVNGTGDRVGGLVGYDFLGDITNCNARSNVSGNEDIGGLVGYSNGAITNCYGIGNVNGKQNVSGLVGYSKGDITNCYATGNISGVYSVGGLVGINIRGMITNSHYNYNSTSIIGMNVITIGVLYESRYNTWLSKNMHLDVDDYLLKSGNDYLINDVENFKELITFGQEPDLSFILTSDLDLSSENDFYIPYFAGYFNGCGHEISGLNVNLPFVSSLGLFGFVASSGSVHNISLTEINVNGHDYVGGLVGNNIGDITKCSVTGNVNGLWYVGGLVGYNYGDITDCQTANSVIGKGDCIGGLVGYNYGRDITNCYSIGCVNGNDSVGGLIGYRKLGSISSCFWDIQTSGQTSSDGGNGKTTEEMTSKNTYSNVGWDFETIWDIEDGRSYPFLRNMVNGPILVNKPPTPKIKARLLDNGDANTSYQYDEIEVREGDIVIFNASESDIGGGPPGYDVDSDGIKDHDMKFTWDWGDSTTVTTFEGTVCKNFSGPAIDHYVNLSVDDGEYNVTINDPFHVIVNLPPVARIDPRITTTFIEVGNRVTFESISTDPNSHDQTLLEDENKSVTWTFGDGGGAYGRVVSHTFQDDGEYDVVLTVTDSMGNVNSDNVTVKVFGNPWFDAPIIIFNVMVNGLNTTHCEVGQTVVFDASDSCDPNGENYLDGNEDTPTYLDFLNVIWDFGDGNISTGKFTTTHAYSEPGQYIVIINITDREYKYCIMSFPINVDDVTIGNDDDDDSTGDDDADDDDTGSSGSDGSNMGILLIIGLVAAIAIVAFLFFWKKNEPVGKLEDSDDGSEKRDD